MKLATPITALALLLSGTAFAHPSHGHSPDPVPPVAEESAATPIPESYPEVIRALSEQLTAAETAVAKFKIADLNKACKQLTDLAAAVPAKASTLPEDGRKTAEATSTQLAEKIAAMVGQARDGELAKVQDGLGTMKADVAVLRGLAN